MHCIVVNHAVLVTKKHHHLLNCYPYCHHKLIFLHGVGKYKFQVFDYLKSTFLQLEQFSPFVYVLLNIMYRLISCFRY